MIIRQALLLPFLLTALAGCREDLAAVPEPVVMTDDVLGYYCQMVLAERPGPKAQIHLDGVPDPIFFAQVRDGIAYLLEPERTAPITAFYVSDMGAAPSWEEPGAANWIAADAAWFVVGSDAVGGMGVPEPVPFSSAERAARFAAERGGTPVRLADIPPDAVLGAVDDDQGS